VNDDGIEADGSGIQNLMEPVKGEIDQTVSLPDAGPLRFPFEAMLPTQGFEPLVEGIQSILIDRDNPDRVARQPVRCPAFIRECHSCHLEG
jgi:hypothetical protein